MKITMFNHKRIRRIINKYAIGKAFYLFESSESKKFELIFEDEIVFRGSQIIGKTANKVLKYDTSNKLYKVMSNESV